MAIPSFGLICPIQLELADPSPVVSENMMKPSFLSAQIPYAAVFAVFGTVAVRILRKPPPRFF